MSDSDTTDRRNAAIEAGRLFSGDVAEAERCHACGELLHPEPEPEYWMQYPLPTCCVLDGLKFCDDYRKPACIDAHLVEHPTPPRRGRAVEEDWQEAGPVPAGFVQVDAVLTAHQAFIVKKWAEAARPKIKAARAAAEAVPARRDARKEARTAAPAKVDAGEEDAPDAAAFLPGTRCEIVSAHHSCFAKDVGKVVIVTKANPDFRSVFAHDDKPVTYRINRNGRRVVVSDPSCIQTIYSMEALRII
jgi:hypothetical protein